MNRILVFISVILFALCVQGQDWRVQYFASRTVDKTFGNRFQTYLGENILTSVDFGTPADIQKASGTILGTRTTNFALKLSSTYTASATGTVSFTVTGDDGFLVYVDGTLNGGDANWKDASARTQTYTFSATSGRSYQLLVLFYQSAGGAALRISGLSSNLLSAAVVPPFYLNLMGTRFAVLGKTVHPDDPNPKCPSVFTSSTSTTLDIPSGWTVAANNQLSQLAAISGQWSQIACLVLADGSAYNTDGTLGTRCTASVTLRNNAITNLPTAPCYGVLISQAALATEVDQTLPPTTGDSVVFNKVAYKSLDGTSVKAAATTTCNSRLFYQSAGLTVSSASDPVIKLITTGAYPFGSANIIVSSSATLSASISTTTGTAVVGDQFIQKITVNGKALFRATPGATCSRIVVQAATTAANSWTSPVTVSKTINPNGQLDVLFAAIDNSASIATKTCQTLPFELPSGWTIVGSDNLALLKKALTDTQSNFGADCLAIQGQSFLAPDSTRAATECTGDNIKTIDVTIGTKTSRLYLPKDCKIQTRIIITRKRTAAELGANLPCGQCVSSGDPHITTFTGDKFTFMGLGEYIYLRPKAGVTGTSFMVYTYQYRLPNRAANSPISLNTIIYVQYGSETWSVTANVAGAQNAKSTLRKNGVITAPGTAGNTIPVASVSAGKGFKFSLPNFANVTVTEGFWNINHLNLLIDLPNALAAKTDGICGTCGVRPQVFCTGSGNLTSTNFNDYSNSCAKPQTVPTPAPPPTTTAAPTPALPCDRTNPGYLQSLAKLSTNQLKDQCDLEYCEDGFRDTSCGNVFPTPEENNICLPPVLTDSNTYKDGTTSYATLDGTAPSADFNETEDDDDAGPSLVPSGWIIASDSPRAKALMLCPEFTFGTQCLNVIKGSSLIGYTHELQTCGSGVHTVAPDCLRPLTPSSRLLLVKDLGLNPNDVRFGSTVFTTANPTVTVTDYNGTPSLRVQRTSVSFTVPFTPAVTVPFSYRVSARVASGTGTATANIKARSSTGALLGEATIQFNADYNQTREVDVPNSGTAASVLITFTTTTSDVYFYQQVFNRESDLAHKNLIKNPSFALGSTTGWTQFPKSQTAWTFNTAEGAPLVTSTSFDEGNTGDRGRGLVQTIDIPENQDIITTIFFRGESKINAPLTLPSSNVDGIYPSDSYSLYLDIGFYDNGQPEQGITAKFNSSASGWHRAETYWVNSDKRKIKSIQLTGLLRGVKGSAFFKNFYLTTLTCSFPVVQTPASTFGDPHIITLDQLSYTVHTVGDHLLYQDDVLSIFTRHCIQAKATVNCIIFMQYNDTSIQIERAQGTNTPYFLVDGNEKILAPEIQFTLNKVGYVSMSGSLTPGDKNSIKFEFYFRSTLHAVTITCHLGSFGDQWLQVYPRPPSSSRGNVRGLLGNFNGDSSDDLTDADGNVIPPNSQYEELYKFAESWKSYDLPLLINNPSNNLTGDEVAPPLSAITDFSANQVAEAKAICANIAMFDSCVLDVLITGDRAYGAAYEVMQGIYKAIEVPSITSNPSSSSSSDNTKRNVAIILSTVLGTIFIAGLVILFIVVRKRRQQPTVLP